MTKRPPLHPAILAASGFLYTDAELTDQDKEYIGRLAQVVADRECAALYKTWPSRYKLLGISKEKGDLYRRTPGYLSALRDAIKLASLEGVAAATHTMTDIATDESHPSVVSAYSALSKTGGMAQDKVINNTQNNNVLNLSLEGQLKLLAEGKKAKTVDVKVIGE